MMLDSLERSLTTTHCAHSPTHKHWQIIPPSHLYKMQGTVPTTQSHSKTSTMRAIQILFFLPALSLLSVTATPVENPGTPSSDRPISLPLEAIPAGVPVFGLGGNSSPAEADVAGLSRGITKRDDCSGSFFCPSLTGYDCGLARGAYIDSGWYCGYTSRVSRHCTAIFTCRDYHGACWAGWFLKQK